MHSRISHEELLIKNLNASTAQSTKAMLSVLNQTQEVGTDSVKMLENQGRQIQSTQMNIDKILYQEQISQHKVNILSTIFGGIRNWFLPTPSQPNHNREVNEKLNQKKKKTKKSDCYFPRRKRAKDEDVIAAAMKGDPNENIYQETEKDLDEIRKKVGNLNTLAVRMGEEINNHIERLDVLHQTTEEAANTMNHLDGQVNYLLHKRT